MKYLACAILLALSACRETVAPKECVGITNNGGQYHADTTFTRCK